MQSQPQYQTLHCLQLGAHHGAWGLPEPVMAIFVTPGLALAARPHRRRRVRQLRGLERRSLPRDAPIYMRNYQGDYTCYHTFVSVGVRAHVDDYYMGLQPGVCRRPGPTARMLSPQASGLPVARAGCLHPLRNLRLFERQRII